MDTIYLIPFFSANLRMYSVFNNPGRTKNSMETWEKKSFLTLSLITAFYRFDS